MKTIPSTKAIALVVGLGAFASAHAQNEVAVAGCYRFLPSVLEFTDRRIEFDSVKLVLDSTHLPPINGRSLGLRRLRPLELGGIRGHERLPFQPGWRAEGESVHVYWSSGFSSLQLRLVARGDTLRGIARHSTDVVGGPEPQVSVTARRVACR